MASASFFSAVCCTVGWLALTPSTKSPHFSCVVRWAASFWHWSGSALRTQPSRFTASEHRNVKRRAVRGLSCSNSIQTTKYTKYTKGNSTRAVWEPGSPFLSSGHCSVTARRQPAGESSPLCSCVSCISWFIQLHRYGLAGRGRGNCTRENCFRALKMDTVNIFLTDCE